MMGAWGMNDERMLDSIPLEIGRGRKSATPYSAPVSKLDLHIHRVLYTSVRDF